MDEADEGYMTPNNVEARGQTSAETRYIRAIVDRGRLLGLDGMVANVYAFGQMSRSAELTPDEVLDRFAALIAEEDSRVALGRVLRFIENHSNWQAAMPAELRLKDFDLPDVTSATAALALLRQVRPRAHPPIPLPESPAQYLARLTKRLEAIAAGRIGQVRPLQR